MDAGQVLDVLDRLGAAGVPAWVGGGWGVDALVGAQTRPHADLDLAVDARCETQAIRALEGAGLRVTEDHRPTRLVMGSSDGRVVDLHPVDFSGPGPGVQRVPGGDPFLYPAHGFGEGRIGGRTVPCLTAAQQLAFHLGYAPTDRDRHDMGLLRDRLGLATPPPYDQPAPAPGGPPDRRRLVLRALLAVVVVAGVYLGLLPRLVDVGQVWATLRAMTWLELATLALAAVWNLVSYLLPQLVALPGLSLRQAALESHASTAVGNLLPAGQAVGLGVTYRFYTSYGFGPAPIALSLLVQGVWNNFVKLGMPIVALGLLVASGDAAGELAPAAVVGLALFLLALAGFAFGLSGQRRAERLGGALASAAAALRRLLRRPGRPDWARGAVAFRAQAVSLLGRRWHWLTLTTLVSHLSLFLVLLLALRHVGVSGDEVSWVEALAGFALVRLLSAFPITPGGLGVVELGLAGALVLAGGEEAPVVAAVLVFRVLTLVLPIPIGAFTWWRWRRTR